MTRKANPPPLTAVLIANDRALAEELPASCSSREAALIWGVALRTAQTRLNLMRVSGVVRWFKHKRRWMKR